MSIQQYRQVQEVAEPPRAEEYRRLGEITARLARGHIKGDATLRAAALIENQKFWSSLRLASVSATNSLPAPLRAQFISLADWVERETVLATLGQADVESLIAVNRQIMEGLAPYKGSLQADTLQVSL
ncbi:MAG TPA: flagellar biosynthesis regulator FlaF [Alphaproteobacteria bacterium]|nr:flagellar biosynthesis regulator FlaF [Alphaproteobacteria bacterium]